MSRTWVDGGTPALSATNLNGIETDLTTALFSAAALATKTANYTATSTDKVLLFNGSSLTATLPDPTTVANRLYMIKNINSSALSVVSAGTSKTIDGVASYSVRQYQVLTVVSDGVAWFILSGGDLLQTSVYKPTVYGAPTGSNAVLTVSVNSSNSNDLLSLENSGAKLTVDKNGYIRKLNGTTNSVVIGVNESSSPEGGAEWTAYTGLAITPRNATGGIWYKANGNIDNTGYHPVADSTSYSTKTANYTITTTDRLIIANGSSLTVTLPDPTTAIHNGRMFHVKNIHSTSLSVVSAGTSKTIDGASSQSLAQWAKMTVVSDGTQWLTTA